MDTSYLAQQVNTIIGQLHGLFDEIGVSSHERESREAELFSALSEALNNQVRLVTSEKKGMIEQAQKMITTIRQMEASLDDKRSSRRYEDEDMKITYPLARCLQVLKEKQTQIGRLHRERFEQVKKLVQALESYSSHLEPGFVRIELPPTAPNQSVPPTFDLSPKYVDKLDAEFTRVYEEYMHRVETVKSLGENMVDLWAELGTPQAQTDNAIVKYYRDAPEQLGLHQEDLARLKSKRDKLLKEKENRERRLRDLRDTVEGLWERLEVDGADRKAFLNSNRGCGIRQINEFEEELARLNELKRQNLHIFVEDARLKLQELWDALYLCEEEMLEFTPAFSDVYSDALLEAHEREIVRLEVLKEQRAPTLALVDKYKSLVQERDELTASAQDSSRLMMRGQKGERRDPGKLLREEKMRKRIAKELPKVIIELRKGLEKWEDEFGRPFLVHGERYLDVIDLEDPPKPNPGPRSKTPANATAAPTAVTPGNSRPNSTLSRAKSVGSLSKPPTAKPGAKTPTASTTTKPTLARSATVTANTVISKGSPLRNPANFQRPPLSNLKNGNNSPERPRAADSVSSATGSLRLVMRAPPPKMRDLLPPPELKPATPMTAGFRSSKLGSSVSIVRQVEPEDVYDDRDRYSSQYSSQTSDSRPSSREYTTSRQTSHTDDSRPPTREYQPPSRQNSTKDHDPPSRQNSTREHNPPSRQDSARASQSPYSRAPPAPRQVSETSTIVSGVSGSENWETYDDTSEPEVDVSEAYYAKVRAAQQAVGFGTIRGIQKLRGVPPAPHHAGHVVVDEDGNRIMSAGSEWTDEDAF
ncbi:microtubule associated protein-domain-containing protein [Triangularia verruculosa]|uniref:Microtubule associated protein-domain-containing protein n=1 Tax=Triangularia verruculosa TaxID=2587418 RepID=A0AAN6X562_9PEZI|nr:microtubule associated protein-domain-containing protein [Triangularia verruculosa]